MTLRLSNHTDAVQPNFAMSRAASGMPSIRPTCFWHGIANCFRLHETHILEEKPNHCGSLYTLHLLQAVPEETEAGRARRRTGSSLWYFSSHIATSMQPVMAGYKCSKECNANAVRNAMQVTPEARFKEDLALDSLDTVEVVMAFEEEFGIEIPDSEADKIISTQDAINFIASHPQAK